MSSSERDKAVRKVVRAIAKAVEEDTNGAPVTEALELFIRCIEFGTEDTWNEETTQDILAALQAIRAGVR